MIRLKEENKTEELYKVLLLSMCNFLKPMFDSQRLYAPYIKGGAFRRWYGNYEYVIKMNKSHYDLLLTMGNHLPSRHRYFLHGITWNDVSTAYYCARYINDGCVFDAAGPMCFYSGDELYLLGFLNSKVNQMFLDVICQGLHYSTGHIPNVPLITEERLGTDQLVEQSLVLSKADWDSFETSWDFQMHPLVATINRHPCFGEYVGSLIQGCFELWQVLCEQRFQRIKANEEELNRIFIDIYGLQGELTPEVADKDVTVRKADLGRDIRSLVSYAVGCMLGRYSPDKPGLQFAGGDWQKWLAQQEAVTYEPDKDGILPITDDEYFNDDIVTMFVEWIKTVYGVETLEENLKFILTYREKDEQEEENAAAEAAAQEELVQQFKGYGNPYSSMLIESKNLIFRGAPGTGKSYLAKEIAADIISNGYYEKYTQLSDEQKKQVEFVQFHPSYDYSDFVEGLRPKVNDDGTMGFELQDGIFKKFVARARKNYEDSQKSQETIEKEVSVQDAMMDFFSGIELGVDKFKTISGNEFTITSVDDKGAYHILIV